MICLARMEFQKLQNYDLRINISVIVHLLYSGDLKIHHIIQAIEISRILGFHVTSGSTPNRYTVIRLKKNFTVCVDLVFGGKCVQFREICLLQCSTIINTFWVDPHSELLKKVPVKPKNCITALLCLICTFRTISPMNIPKHTKCVQCD